MCAQTTQPPTANLRQYIIDSRKSGFPDSKILEILKQAKWPDDIINAAQSEADAVVKRNPEPAQPLPEKKEEPADKKETVADKKESNPAEPQEGLFTQPPAEVLGKDEKKAEKEKPKKKKFSLLSLVALLFSPIPFLGLGIALGIWDNLRKNNKTGGFFAFVAVLINVAVILGILWVILQVFTLPYDKQTVLAQWLSEKFGISEMLG